MEIKTNPPLTFQPPPTVNNDVKLSDDERIVSSDSPLLLFVGPQDWLYSKLADINIFLIQNRPGRPDVKYIQ